MKSLKGESRQATSRNLGIRKHEPGQTLVWIELFVVLSMCIAYFALVEYFAFGGSENTTNGWVFSSCSIPGFHLNELGDVWKGRLSGLLLTGWLFDFLIKNSNFRPDQYACLFALYQTIWLFLVFLTIIFALRHSLFINLGISAGLMYGLMPASGLYFYPWDMPATLFFTLATLFFAHRRMLLMAAAICAGTFFKETVLVCALLVLFAGQWRWWRRVLLLGGIVAVYVLGKKLLLNQLFLQVAAFSMNNATNLGGLFKPTILVENLKELFSPTLNHAVFANAGTVVAVLVLGWRKRFLPYMAVILTFLAGQLVYGGFSEFRIFMQVLPLGLILLSERWQESAGCGPTNESAAGSAQTWAMRRTFPVLVPMTILLIGMSGGIAAWRYYNICVTLGPFLKMQSQPGKYDLTSEMSIGDLEAASQLFRIKYFEAGLNRTINTTNYQQSFGRMDAVCKFLLDQYTETELKLGMIFAANRRLTDAMGHYQRVLELNTNSVVALNNLAWLRATASDPGLRDGNGAVRLAERACQLSQYKEAFLIGTLAAAYAEAGRFDEAVTTAEKAREVALANGQRGVADNNQRLLDLYKSRQAYHQETGVAPETPARGPAK